MNFRNILLAGLFSILIFGGCTDKYITEEYITEGGNAYIFSHLQEDVADWTWNEKLQRYESEVFKINGLNNDIFNYGKVIVDMFWLEDYKGQVIDVNYNLPYEKDYFIEKDGVKVWDFTQRISYSMTAEDIVFYIENTKKDAFVGLDIPRTFKIVVIWDGIIEE